jgi:hypothetical protein
MCPTSPRKDLKGREDAEPLWGGASEMYFLADTRHGNGHGLNEERIPEQLKGEGG